MDRTTMDTALEDVLKEDIIPEIFVEEKAVKVYGKLYGLTNLGRTFFTSEWEVYKYKNEADKQMMQKYGTEIYNKYIKCDATPLKELPDKFYEASGDFNALSKPLKELEDYLVRKSKEPEWSKTYGKDAQTLQQQIRQIKGQNGATDPNNSKAYQEINKILQTDPWKPLATGDLKGTIDNIKKGWT